MPAPQWVIMTSRPPEPLTTVMTLRPERLTSLFDQHTGVGLVDLRRQ
jgi:hypothetical protein